MALGVIEFKLYLELTRGIISPEEYKKALEKNQENTSETTENSNENRYKDRSKIMLKPNTQTNPAWDLVLKTAFAYHANPTDDTNLANLLLAALKYKEMYQRVASGAPVQNSSPKPSGGAYLDNSLVNLTPIEDAGDFKNIYMHIVTDHELSDDEILRASGCLGYALKAVLQGDQLSDPEVIQSFSSPLHNELVVKYDYDSDSSGRTSPPDHYEEAFDLAKKYIFEGTPIRKTDQQGQGTRGTRLVDGLGTMAPNGNNDALVSFLVA